MKFKMLLLVTCLGLVSCGKNAVNIDGKDSDSGGDSKEKDSNSEDGPRLQGTISKVFNLLIPSAYAAPLPETTEANASYKFVSNMFEIANPKAAFHNIQSQIIDLQMGGADFEIIGLGFADAAKVQDYGFILTKFLNETNEIVGVVASPLDKDGKYDMVIPASLVGKYSYYSFEGYRAIKGSDALIIREAIATVAEIKNNELNLNAVTSLISDKFQAYLAQKVNEGERITALKYENILEIKSAAFSKIDEALAVNKVTPDQFNLAAKYFAIMVPLAPKLLDVSEEFLTKKECVPGTVSTFLASGSIDILKFITSAEDIFLILSKLGVTEYKFENTLNLMIGEKPVINNDLQNKISEIYSGKFIEYVMGVITKNGTICAVAVEAKAEMEMKK